MTTRTSQAKQAVQYATHDDLADFRQEVRQDIARFAQSFETNFSGLRKELRDDIQKIGSQVEGVTRTDWGTVLTGISIVVTMVALGAALIWTMITNEGDTRELASQLHAEIRTQVVSRLDERDDYERKLSQYADELRDDTHGEVVRRLEQLVAAVEEQSKLRHDNQQDAINELKVALSDMDTVVQREMRLLDEVLQRELKLNVERLDALINVVTDNLDKVKLSRFTDADGEKLREELLWLRDQVSGDSK